MFPRGKTPLTLLVCHTLVSKVGMLEKYIEYRFPSINTETHLRTFGVLVRLVNTAAT